MQTATNGPWTLKYYGGRLADIHHAGVEGAIECLQVADATPETENRMVAEWIARDLKAELDEWVAEQGDCYVENVVRYR